MKKCLSMHFIKTKKNKPNLKLNDKGTRQFKHFFRKKSFFKNKKRKVLPREKQKQNCSRTCTAQKEKPKRGGDTRITVIL